MGTAPQALLLSTIATDANDWHIGRFSLLGTMIRTAGEEMDPSFNLTISDYPTSDAAEGVAGRPVIRPLRTDLVDRSRSGQRA